MKSKIIIICGLFFLTTSLAFSQIIRTDNIYIGQIHAGACFSYNDENDCDIILIETHDEKYFLGWNWGKKYKLYSNFSDSGGCKKEECLAYLRGRGCRYTGRAE